MRNSELSAIFSIKHLFFLYVAEERVSPCVSVYRRCVYCKKGQADARFYKTLNATLSHTEVVNIFSRGKDFVLRPFLESNSKLTF